MQAGRTNSVKAFRERMRRQGLVRVEIRVRKQDAALVREVAFALSDPERESETRALLREKIARPADTGLKALLEAAPLEGIELGRPRDFGRDGDL